MLSVDWQNDPENDRMISDHILCMHRYRSPGEQDGEGMIISYGKQHDRKRLLKIVVFVRGWWLIFFWPQQQF